MALPAVGPMGSVAAPGISTSTTAGVAPGPPQAPGPASPPALPNDEELDGGKPAANEDSGGLE